MFCLPCPGIQMMTTTNRKLESLTTASGGMKLDCNVSLRVDSDRAAVSGLEPWHHANVGFNSGRGNRQTVGLSKMPSAYRCSNLLWYVSVSSAYSPLSYDEQFQNIRWKLPADTLDDNQMAMSDLRTRPPLCCLSECGASLTRQDFADPKGTTHSLFTLPSLRRLRDTHDEVALGSDIHMSRERLEA
jgi:hypothetical protein